MEDNHVYERMFQLKVGKNNGPGLLIGLRKDDCPIENLFVDVYMNTPIKHTHTVQTGKLGGAHYALTVPYKNMDIKVTFRAHSHGVVLTTPKSEVPITLEEIDDEKASEIYQKTKYLKEKIIDSKKSDLERKLKKAVFEGYKI